MPKRSFKADIAVLPEILDFVSEELKKYKVEKEKIVQSMLSVEEICISLIEHSTSTELKQKKITINVHKFFDKISVSFRCPGEYFSLFEKQDEALLSYISHENDTVVESPEIESLLRSNILSGFHSNIQYGNKKSINKVKLTVAEKKASNLCITLCALFAAIVFGYLLNTVIPPDLTKIIDAYFLIPVKSMFLSSLKMVVAPVVFFSIISCIVQFGDISEFGRTGGKVLLIYFFTTVFAIICGMVMYFLLTPGGSMDSLAVSDASKVITAPKTVSLLSMITGITPSNFVKAFLESDVLQIIFLAVLCGISLSKLGTHAATLSNFFEACNSLFLTITSIIIKFIPLSVFCSVSSMIVHFGMDKLLPLISLIGTVVLGCCCLICFYASLVYFIGHLNPFTYLRKFLKTFLTIFPLSSSNASIPFNIAFCRDEAGIDPKLYSFSIPLGATVNMDGSCIYMSVTSLFLMHLYGIPITLPTLFSMALTIAIISIGAPGIPGALIVCITVLLEQIGVPVEAVAIVLGIDPIFAMIRASCNSTGDVAVTLAIAGHDNLIDREKFNS